MDPYQPLYCLGLNTNVVGACIHDGCQHSPFMCAQEECKCHNAHRGHTTTMLRGLFERCNRTPELDEANRRGFKAMEQMLNQLVETAVALRNEHTRLAENRVLAARHRETRDKLIERDGNHRFTGDKLHQLLRELEQPRPAQYPYWLSHEAIFERLTPQVLHGLQELVRDTWRFEGVFRIDGRKVKIEDFKHIEAEKRELGRFGVEYDWSVRTVVLNGCTSDDWPGVLKRLAELSCVTGVQLSDCKLGEKDLEPLFKMEHLEKLSLGN